MAETDGLLAAAQSYAETFTHGDLPMRPRRPVAIVTCMDARINLYELFGLREGDLNILRNAGGAVTDDVIRSLVVSQRRLGTREVLVIQHRDCGMRVVREEEFFADLESEVGQRPPWALGEFGDPEDEVRAALARLAASPFLAAGSSARGFLYDERTGRLAEVGPPAAAR